MTPPPLLDHLAAKAGLPAIRLNDDGAVSLALGERVTLTLRWLPDDEALVMFSVLGSLPLHDRQALLEELLRANRFGRGTGHATLSLDEAQPPRALLAQRLQTRHLEPGDFVQAVEAFVAVAERWMVRLDEAVGPARAEPVLPAAGAWQGPANFA